jgi:hypothetical protein
MEFWGEVPMKSPIKRSIPFVEMLESSKSCSPSIFVAPDAGYRFHQHLPSLISGGLGKKTVSHTVWGRGAASYFPNTFFKSGVVWEAGLVGISAAC